ncbi:MAG: hypothetical protein KZQ79_18390, partial [Candidatus Thiodiazotropha sp. (ex Lucinoma borealis)]|nr:hypothetical protein [Candidatus Thiodiazotropha sp. (ex Lucinoma borealis)]
MRKRASRGEEYSQGLLKLWQSIKASQQRLDQRREQVPPISFPDELPICHRLDEIKQLIQAIRLLCFVV